jgi:hypothetical protein
METFMPMAIMTYMEFFRPAFRANHFTYFQAWVVGMMLLGEGRKCVSQLARVCWFCERHVSNWERFVAEGNWDVEAVRQQLVALIREVCGEQLLVAGAYLGWIDTTLVAKVCGKMPGVQTWHDHSGNPDRGARMMGHHWAVAGLMGMGVVRGIKTVLSWPISARLLSGQNQPCGYVGSEDGVVRGLIIWDVVGAMVAQLQGWLGGKRLRVVCDAYFSKAVFLNRMIELKVDVITRMRKDGLGWDDPVPPTPAPDGVKKRGRPVKKPQPGQEWKLAQLVKANPVQSVTVWLYGQVRSLKIVTRDLWIRDVVVQKVRVVVIQRASQPLILLCTDLGLSPTQIIEIYGMRASLELNLRDAKQYLGFGDYQCQSLTAMSRYVALSLISFCLWRLVALANLTADWLPPATETTPLSFRRISCGLRRLVIQRIFDKSLTELNFTKSKGVPAEILRMMV